MLNNIFSETVEGTQTKKVKVNNALKSNTLEKQSASRLARRFIAPQIHLGPIKKKNFTKFACKSWAKSDFSGRDSNIKDSHSRLEN